MEINLIHLISQLIKDYEKVYGVTRFEVKKINNKFVVTYLDQKMLNILKESFNSVGKTFPSPPLIFPLTENSEDKVLAIFEKAWNGEDMVDYESLSNNDKIVVYSLKPILKDEKTDRLEGHCVLLDGKDFTDYLS